jgi:hypothetical protein
LAGRPLRRCCQADSQNGWQPCGCRSSGGGPASAPSTSEDGDDPSQDKGEYTDADFGPSYKEPDWDQTPVEICQEIIRAVPWSEGELVLEPFSGDRNFYNNLPECVRKEWCEINRGRDVFEYHGPTPDSIITNAPFRDAAGGNNLVVPCLERCFQVARRRVIYFVNHKVFNALTPGRLAGYKERGWGITHLSVWDVKKWFGRYYLIIWEKGEPSIIGIPGRLTITLKGGNNARTIAGGGDAKDDLQNTETPPSLCQWIYERLADAGIHPKTILDPCAGNGNLTRPFRPRSQVIEYEINQDRDFFEAKAATCDLVICNPPWKKALRWLQQIVEVVGNRTPIVFICPVLFFIGYKDAPCRQYLESPEAPVPHHIIPLPADTFVKVYCPGAILWLNLTKMQDVALVPSSHLIRSNTINA